MVPGLAVPVEIDRDCIAFAHGTRWLTLSARSGKIPPFGLSVMTSAYGVVVFVGCDGEAVDPEILHACYVDILLA